MKTIALACAVSLLTGCAALPTHVKVEVEHISHPLAGWPCSDKYTEDAVTEASTLAVWRSEHLYLEAGVGYNLKGANGSGFYGPALTGIVRAGAEIKVRR
jgi:hypothetical protein